MADVAACVPNVSEGRDASVLAALSEAVAAIPRVALLDVHADRWHHRAVFTIAGEPADLTDAAFALARTAVQRIDLRQHRGAHPRMGAVDVIPFVPLAKVTMSRCIDAATSLGERIGDELGVPVFLYGAAAHDPARTVLARIRGRGAEELAGRIGDEPAAMPDFGPARLHPTAGATAVGARGVLVAFNVVLETSDVSLARTIARAVRASTGGLPAVQAKGFLVDGRAQVSMNLLDVDVTAPGTAFHAVAAQARAAGAPVHHSEIVGLIPQRATAGWEAWKLAASIEGKILERRLREAGLGGETA